MSLLGQAKEREKYNRRLVKEAGDNAGEILKFLNGQGAQLIEAIIERGTSSYINSKALRDLTNGKIEGLVVPASELAPDSEAGSLRLLIDRKTGTELQFSFCEMLNIEGYQNFWIIPERGEGNVPDKEIVEEARKLCISSYERYFGSESYRCLFSGGRQGLALIFRFVKTLSVKEVGGEYPDEIIELYGTLSKTFE